MSYRIIQWGTGASGKHALRAIIDDPELELVGVRVYGENKIGRDAGELCDRPATGVHAVDSLEALPLDRTDCVLYMPRQPDYDEIATLLRRGIHVITTAGNVYPRARGMDVVNKLEDACWEGNTVFHGSGISPAFMPDVLPLTLSGLSHRASRIIVQEVSDVQLYTSEAPEIMMDHIGFGKSPQEAMSGDNPFLDWMAAYFHESILMIAEHHGRKLEKVVDNHEVAVARSAVVLPGGRRIEPGTVACRRFEWQGIVNGEVAIIIRIYWKTSLDIEPAWPVGSEKEVEWTVTVEGKPSVQAKVTICESFDPDNPGFGRGGEEAAVIGTAIHAVNAIPFVCKAQPGIRTFLDLPIIGSLGAFPGKA